MAEGLDLSPEQTAKSLWVGDLPGYVDEGLLYSVFFATGQLVSVKLIRNRATGLSEGYAFLEFRTHEAADQVLKTYNGQIIPGTDQVFRLNWAAYGVGKAAPAGEDHSLFVGDLAPDVTDIILQEYFRQFYPSVRSAKVITDAATGRSKGYGFVRFSSPEERDRALTDMGGHFLSNRPIRVSLATAKKNSNGGGLNAAALAQQAPHPSDLDPTNTTLFIGGLSSQVSEEQLRASFARFGDIIYVKIPQGKGCGFVQFVLRTAAERAMSSMNGQVMGSSAMRISWGRSSSRAANQANQAARQLNGMGAPFGLGGGFPMGFDPAMAAAASFQFQAAAAAAGGSGAGMAGLPGMDYAAAFGLGGPGMQFGGPGGYPGSGLGMNGLGNGGALAGLMPGAPGGGGIPGGPTAVPAAVPAAAAPAAAAATPAAEAVDGVTAAAGPAAAAAAANGAVGAAAADSSAGEEGSVELAAAVPTGAAAAPGSAASTPTAAVAEKSGAQGGKLGLSGHLFASLMS